MKKLFRYAIAGIRRWSRNDGPGLAAAVSFYAVFAMAPLLVFAVVVASRALGPEQAKASAVEWLSDMLPVEAAETLVALIHVQFLAEGAWWSNLVSGLVLVWASSLIFVRLAKGTRILFGESEESARLKFRRNLIGRGIAILFAIAAGLLICLLFITSSFVAPLVRDSAVGIKSLISVGNALVLMLGGIVLLQSVTSIHIRKRALFSTGGFLFLAFILGRSLFQTYISHSAISSAYGVASSLVVFLLWIYYMAAGYFIGAAVCAEFQISRLEEDIRGDSNPPDA